MKLIHLTSDDREALKHFVANHPHGSIEQSWDWGLLQTGIPGRPAFHVLAVEEEGQWIASSLVIRQIMGLKKTWLWCPRGPLLPENEEAQKAAWTLLKHGLKNLAKSHGDVFIRMEPGVASEEFWCLDEKTSSESYLPQDTLMLKLHHSEEFLLGQMTQKGRYNIRQAEKKGVYVRLSGAHGIPDFYDLLKETGERDGFHVHDKDFYIDFFDKLGDQAKLYMAYTATHEPIGGLLATHFGATATYYFGASSNHHRDQMAPYALQWFAIQTAKQEGFSHYDFLGIAPEGAAKHSLAGVTQFKTRFGGERVHYHGAQVMVIRPFWWGVYKTAKLF